MQKSIVALSLIATLGLAACQPQQSATEQAAAPAIKKEEMTDAQKQAYAMGASMGMFVFTRNKNMILVTRSKKKVVGLDGYGIKITKQEIIK